MKKKSLATLLSGFLTVALTGVGFASWLITSQANETVDGSFVVEDVVDKSFKITDKTFQETGTSGATDDSKIIFGKPVTPTYTGDSPWLKNSSTVTDKLEAILKVTIDKIQNVDLSTFDVTCELPEITESTYGDPFEKDLVAEPTITYSSTFNGTYSDTKTFSATTGEASIFVKVSFAYGTVYQGANPYDFYNAKSSSAEISSGVTYATHAYNSIKSIYNLNSQTYKLRIVANSATE